MPWRPIPFAPGYEASAGGRVRRIGATADIKPILQADGYLKVWLSIDGHSRPFRLHRLIFRVFHGEPGDLPVDHENRRRTDCRARNLRLGTCSQNNANRRTRPSRTGYRGVVVEPSGRFRAFISTGGRTRPLGRFADAISAAAAYDKAARDLFGAFASVNFPEARA